MLRLKKGHLSQDFFAILLLVMLAGLFYAFTFNRSSYSYILRADEGVSLANAVRVTQGYIPQRDFPSYYGPVMPYVYGIPFKLFGASLALMRAEWAVLYIWSIVLFYRIGRYVLPPFAAFAAAAMMIGQQHTPLYTYNHIGFVLVTEGLLLLLMGATPQKDSWRFRLQVAGLFLLALLVKFNEAFVVLIIMLMAVWIVNHFLGRQQTDLPRMSMIAAPGAIAMGLFAVITAALNLGLSKPQFMRNFPMLPQYQASIGGYQYVKLVLSTPFKVGWHAMTARRWYAFWYENYVFAILLTFAIALLGLYFAARFLASDKYRQRLGQDAWKAVLLLGVAAGTYHEFYLTGNHWSTPMYIGFGLVALVFLIWKSLENFARARVAVVAALLLVCVVSDLYYVKVVHGTYSQYHFDDSHARIYSSMDSDAPVVADVTSFLEQSTPAEQPMAAFPHDALVVYLAGRKNAMRDDDYQWMLFPDHESDLEVVNELEQKKVPRIVISNFVGIRHGRPVFFGKDYLPETFKYIQEHYTVVKTFGNNPRNYQVRYLERIHPAGAVSGGN